MEPPACPTALRSLSLGLHSPVPAFSRRPGALKAVVDAAVAGAKVLDLCAIGDKIILEASQSVYRKSAKDGAKIERGTQRPPPNHPQPPTESAQPWADGSVNPPCPASRPLFPCPPSAFLCRVLNAARGPHASWQASRSRRACP